jgi:very-short-patch-repair endonuclease
MAKKGSKQPSSWRKLMSKILKGRKLSKQHKESLSKAHIGKKLSPEHSAAIKEGQLKSPNRKKMGFWKGKTLSEETKRKMSLARMGNQYTLGKKMPSSRENIIKLRKKGKYETGIEKKIRFLLTDLSIIFEQEKQFPSVGLVDFYLSNYNVVIECDGEHWHNNQKAKENDKRRDRVLKQNGIRVLRLPEMEINKQIEKCRAKIIRIIRR